jgi:hypothetical protein
MSVCRNQFRVILLALGIAPMISSCVTYLPVDEWTIARSAYEAAKDADSARYVPSIWFNAEQTYREAQKAYKDRHYAQAKRLFNEARSLCEQAENAARLARQKSGEVVP